MNKWQELGIGAFVATVVVSIGITTGIGVYWLFDNQPPIRYIEMSVTDNTGAERYRFKAGETFLLTRYFCVRQRQAIDLDRRFVSMDGKISFFVGSSTTVLPLGCHRSTRGVAIPVETPTGKYHYVVSAAFSNNPLQNGVIDLPAPLIEVVR